MNKQKDITPLSKADAQFFQGFFEEYKNQIYRAAAACAPAAADRDDLVQEAVMRLMKNISVLRQLPRCKTAYYIVITVRTAYIDMLRAQRDLEYIPLNHDEDFLNAFSERLPQSRNEADIHLRMAVRQLKQSLSEKDWMVLVGKVIMGYTHEELGLLLQMNPASIRMVLSRAKTKAREILQREDWIGGE